MIDNEEEVRELIQALNRHLPMRAFATPPLVDAVRQQRVKINDGDAIEIDSVVYLGDEGGVSCAIKMDGGKSVVVASITHVRFEADHPLAQRIHAYQFGRTQKLVTSSGGQSISGGRRSRNAARLATKPNVKIAGGASNDALKKFDSAKKNDLKQRYRAACRLWILSEFKRAANSFRDLMKVEPSDPYFAGYWLVSCLFQLRPSDELEKLLQHSDDNSGVWRFAQALEAFRWQGDTEDAQRLLVEADHLEPGFEDYLLRDKIVDASREVRFDLDEVERCSACARLFLPAWRSVSGAATWARRVLKVPPRSADPNDAERQFPQDELRALPVCQGVWQVGLLAEPVEPNSGDSPTWLFAVANIDRQEVRTMTVIDQPVTEKLVWNLLISSFLSPLDGVPERPSTLVVGRRDFRDAWEPLLSRIGVSCSYKKDPQPIGQLMEAMGDLIDQHHLSPAPDVDLSELPQSDEVWQADFIKAPTWVQNEQDGSYRPWSVLILEKSRSKALLTAHTKAEPTPELLLDFLVRTMASSKGKSPERPRMIEISDSDCYDHLRPQLEAAGIACRLVDELSEFNEFCLRLARSIDGSEKCALADGKGVTRAQMESLYEAAEYYFRKAPWSDVPGEIPIEIRCDDPKMGTRFAVVLGRTGVQLGLCICDDWKTTEGLLNGYIRPEENCALVLCYDEAEIMAAVDLQLIDRLGWPIATPEAWPAVMRLQKNKQPKSANANELVFLDAALRAIPNFITSGTSSRTVQVETGTRTVELHLEWDWN